MPEKEKEEKKRIEQKGEETKQNKPSFWNRIKKPLLTGVMAAGLLVTPMKKAEGVNFTVDVPVAASKEIIEKRDKLLFKLIKKAWHTSDADLRKKCIELALQRLEKTKSFSPTEKEYIGSWLRYFYAEPIPSLEETEKQFNLVIEEIDNVLKENKDDYGFLDLKASNYRGAAEVFQRAGNIKKAKEYWKKELELIKYITDNFENLKLSSFPKEVSEEDIKRVLSKNRKYYRERYQELKKLINEQ